MERCRSHFFLSFFFFFLFLAKVAAVLLSLIAAVQWLVWDFPSLPRFLQFYSYFCWSFPLCLQALHCLVVSILNYTKSLWAHWASFIFYWTARIFLFGFSTQLYLKIKTIEHIYALTSYITRVSLLFKYIYIFIKKIIYTCFSMYFCNLKNLSSNQNFYLYM